MQYLQGDLAALVMYGAGHGAVAAGLGFGCQHRAALHDAPVFVRSDAAGHDQANLAARPPGIERRKTLEAVWRFLKADVHRAHQHPVSQCRKAKVEGLEQFGIGHGEYLLCNQLRKTLTHPLS